MAVLEDAGPPAHRVADERRAFVRRPEATRARHRARDDPKLLLLDEPTAGMSPQETGERRPPRAHRRRRELTVLFTEHDMDVVFSVAQRIAVLHQGRLIAEGRRAEIRGHAEVKRVYLGRAIVARSPYKPIPRPTALASSPLRRHPGCGRGRRRVPARPQRRGKTTTLRTIVGLTPPRGRVMLDGTDITGWPPLRVARRDRLRAGGPTHFRRVDGTRKSRRVGAGGRPAGTHEGIAFAGGLFQFGTVVDGHISAGIGNQAGLLQNSGGQCDAGTAGTQHLRQQLLGQRKTVSTHPVRTHQQPTAQPFFDFVQPVAGGDLGGLHSHELRKLLQTAFECGALR